MDEPTTHDGTELNRVLRVSPEAHAFILAARAGEPDAERLALFLEVSGAANGVYTYEMWFEVDADAAPGDSVERDAALSVVVLASSVEQVRGATLDVAEQAGEPGLVIRNPNVPPTEAVRAGAMPAGADLASDVARLVAAVLEEQVNPQIASHGGRADLVGVAEGVAYLRLSGGCQGCGMAAVTLSQGISVAIRDAVPEIVDIVDVTAHESGENPYFESAKK